MITQPVAAQHRAWIWILRVAFFVFGVFLLALCHIPGYACIPFPFPPPSGWLFIVLSLFVSASSRAPIGWSLLAFIPAGAALALVGIVLYGLGGGPAGDNVFVGFGFMFMLLGLLCSLVSAVAAIVAGLNVLAREWRERHGGTTAPPPTGSQ